MLTMHSANQRDGREADDSQPPVRLMTRRERQVAFAIGILAGGSGGYAVFESSNQAGTVVLLLISLLFLAMGVEGTPLLRQMRRPSAQRVGRLHRDGTSPRVEPQNAELAGGVVDDIAPHEATHGGYPVVSTARQDGGSVPG